MKYSFLAALLTVYAMVHEVAGQYNIGSKAHDVVMQDSLDDLVTELENLPLLEDIYFPHKYEVPRDYYVYKPPDRQANYTQNVIFDPCRGNAFNCCNDTFGTPEFRVDVPATESTPSSSYWVRDDGTIIPEESTRWSSPTLFIEERCTDDGVPFARCVTARLAKRETGRMPACWNYNDTVVGDAACRAPSDGSLIPACIEIGYMQNAYVVECGGKYEDDPHCGTFLEIHRPGSLDILSDMKLKAVYASGYRMAIISTTYHRDPTKTLCYDNTWQGNYEIWWVQRTRSKFFIQRILPFRIITPWCDWDALLNRFYPYATVPAKSALPVDDLFVEEKLVLTRTRTEGTADGRPGPGMGGLYVAPTSDSFPPMADFFTDDEVTYSYPPVTPEYTIKRGIIEPPNIPDGDI